jgi:putative tryptophan/tyrosine transport system substrate-binding protein
MRRRDFVARLSAFAATGLPLFNWGTVPAQAEAKRPVIAHLTGLRTAVPPYIRENTFISFLNGLSELGYVEGRDYEMVARLSLFPDPTRDLDDIVNVVKPDVILAAATWEAVLVHNATRTIPIVCPAIADGVRYGLISTEARPGGNVTGLEPYVGGLPTKQIELAREILPNARRVGLLNDMSDPKGPPQLADLRMAAKAFELEVVTADAGYVQDIPGAFASLSDSKVDFVIVLMTNIFFQASDKVGALALERRLPTVCGYREQVIGGALVSYGVDVSYLFHRAAYFVDRILKGAKPGDLPIEFPTSFPLVANVRTARALGITLSPTFLARCDQIIE